MLFKIHPVKHLSGSVNLPASKSYSIRAVFVSLCGGQSRIVGISECEDAQAALAVAKALGAKATAEGSDILISMPKDRILKQALKVNVHESGTSLRFVLPLLPFFCATAEVVGSGTLVGRPNDHLCAALRVCGLRITGSGNKESVPVKYNGGVLPGGKVIIDGSLSSQFISALMISASLVEKDTHLLMSGDTLVSRDYVIMTRQILDRAGIKVMPSGKRAFHIAGSQRCKGLKNFQVPSDWGLAAFFMAAAALVSSDIVLKGRFDDKLIQSDGKIVAFLTKMGMKFERTPRSFKIKGPCILKGREFSLKDCPDLVPIMAVTAMFAQGTTILKDIGHARVKESDRISDLREELLKAGADIEEKQDMLIINPKSDYKKGVVLDPHHDHRLAMAFAVLGIKLGVTVKDIECTAKSYPGFVKDLKSITLNS